MNLSCHAIFIDNRKDMQPMITEDTIVQAEQDKWALYAAAIGPNAERYLSLFQKFEASGIGLPSWNPTAFFLTTFWFAYRKMDGLAILNFFSYFATALVAGVISSAFSSSSDFSDNLFGIIWAILLVVTVIIVPLYADGLYYLFLKRAINRVKKSVHGRDEQIAKLKSKGGVSRAVPFMVVLLIGGFLGLSAYWSISASERYMALAQVSAALEVGNTATAEVDGFASKNGRYPKAGEMDFSGLKDKVIGSISLGPDSNVRLVLKGSAEIDGRSLVFSRNEATSKWKCSGSDLEGRYLPKQCQ